MKKLLLPLLVLLFLIPNLAYANSEALKKKDVSIGDAVFEKLEEIEGTAGDIAHEQLELRSFQKHSFNI